MKFNHTLFLAISCIFPRDKKMISCLLITTLQNCFTGEMTSTEISSSLDAITSFQHNTLSHDLLTLCRQAHWNKRKNKLRNSLSSQLSLVNWFLVCFVFLSSRINQLERDWRRAQKIAAQPTPALHSISQSRRLNWSCDRRLSLQLRQSTHAA